MRDFTHNIYKELLKSLKEKNYQFITANEYATSKYNKNRPFVIMRHDVDRRPKNSLKMAKIENSMEVKATYYFRDTPQTLKPKIIKEMVNLGVEIGYHYESLAKTNGNYEKAIKDFRKNLYRLRELYPIKTIAMHGRPTSKWDSRLLWDKYDYKEYGIIFEPYFDIDFQEVLYITDAGRAWDNDSINLRDKVTSDFNFKFANTAQIISDINSETLPKKILINIHPEHWAEETIEWYKILIIRKIKNYIKKLILN